MDVEGDLDLSVTVKKAANPALQRTNASVAFAPSRARR